MNQTQQEIGSKIDYIHEVIRSARIEASDNGFYFILWGWTILIASLSHFFLAYFEVTPYPFVSWLVVIPSFIASMIYGIKQDKDNPSKSHLVKVYSQIWFGFLGAYFISWAVFGLPYGMMVITLLAGYATYLTGVVLKFNPYKLGGIFFGLCALSSIVVPEQFWLLIIAVSVLGGYLIPVYLFKNRKE